MFAQIIKGRAADAAGIERLQQRWLDELAPEADGWLGVTGGVAADGTMFAVVRFADEQAARRNSDRPEQGAWWGELLAHLDGPPAVADCDDVQVWMGGGDDTAGFVQIIEGGVRDREAVTLLLEDMEQLAGSRPELLGGLLAWHDDGTFTETAYFTSEHAAREGERGDLDAHGQEVFERWFELTTDLRYYDLTAPWIASPSG